MWNLAPKKMSHIKFFFGEIKREEFKKGFKNLKEDPNLDVKIVTLGMSQCIFNKDFKETNLSAVNYTQVQAEVD